VYQSAIALESPAMRKISQNVRNTRAATGT
jgi:hypothetical protein